MLRKNITTFLSVIILVSCFGCSGCSVTSDKGKDVTVSWAANRETTVNMTGGGYVVYYGNAQGFDTNYASNTNVSYTSGTTAPTSTTINLTSGTWYIKIVAYGSSVSGTKVYSRPSSEYVLQVGN